MSMVEIRAIVLFNLCFIVEIFSCLGVAQLGMAVLVHILVHKDMSSIVGVT